MGILDTIKSLFGKGRLKFNVTLADGRSGTVKTKYIGHIESVQEAEKLMKRRLEFELGVKVENIELVDHLSE